MAVFESIVATPDGFEWDRGNSGKNMTRHGVSDGECEEVFFNEPLVAGHDIHHSRSESRHYAYGQTDGGTRLFVVFTLRGSKIRVISARDMNRKEKESYEKAQKHTRL